jgi:hypothetical protein
MARITTQEKIDFFIQLDRDLRNHPTHDTDMEDDELPWSSEAIRDLLLEHPERKRNFMRYTRERGNIGNLGLGSRLWRMWTMIKQM